MGGAPAAVERGRVREPARGRAHIRYSEWTCGCMGCRIGAGGVGISCGACVVRALGRACAASRIRVFRSRANRARGRGRGSGRGQEEVEVWCVCACVCVSVCVCVIQRIRQESMAIGVVVETSCGSNERMTMFKWLPNRFGTVTEPSMGVKNRRRRVDVARHTTEATQHDARYCRFEGQGGFFAVCASCGCVSAEMRMRA